MKTDVKCKLFNLMITEELREAIRRDAFEQDMSMSEVVRKVLEEHYKIYGDE